MEKREYEVLYELEDNYWWHAGLRDLVLWHVGRFTGNKGQLRILDAGCGTGGMLKNLAQYKAYGLEISDYAIQFCKLRKIDNIVRGSICSVPFKKEFFDIVLCLGVLYHIGVENDVRALEELYNLLRKDGILILNIPAYDFLKSRHDRAIHTRHRYIAGEIRKKLEEAGFTAEKISYRNTVLFPPAFLVRMAEKILPKAQSAPKSDINALPAPINELLKKILFLENRLIHRLNFPFGLSIFCVARKDKTI